MKVGVAVLGSVVAVSLGGYAIASSVGTDEPKTHTVFVPAGEAAPSGVPQPVQPEPGEPDMTVYTDPLGGRGLIVDEVKDGDLAFKVDVPDGLGAASMIAISKSTEDPVFQEAIWIYSDPDYGDVAVVESVAFQTQEELEALTDERAGCEITYSDDQDGYSSHCSTGGASLVEVGAYTGVLIDGAPAGPAAASEVSDGPVLRTVSWLEPLVGMPPEALEGHAPNAALEVRVMSASSKITAERLLALAQEV